MKYKVFILFGKERVQIFEHDEIRRFNEIKENIQIYEFNTIEEAEAFKKGVDEAVGYETYALLNVDEVARVMEANNG